MSQLALTINSQKRSTTGTGIARALRRKAHIPAVCYGKNKANLSISLDQKSIQKLYQSCFLFNTLITLNIDDEEQYKVIAQDISLDRVTDIVTHVDFRFIDGNHHSVNIPIKFANQQHSTWYKRGGFLNKIKHSLLLECPINNIPQYLSLDLKQLSSGDVVKAGDLALPEDCSLKIEPKVAIASIMGGKK
jgi:large subunit ribosomal protein L25